MDITFEIISDLIRLPSRGKTREWIESTYEKVAGKRMAILQNLHEKALWIEANGIKNCPENEIKKIFGLIYDLYELEAKEKKDMECL